MNETLAKWIFVFGCRARRTPVRVYLARLEESQFRSPEEQAHHQFERLRALVAHAWDHAPFYRGLFAKHGIEPGGIESLDDLRRLPSVGKSEIIANRSGVQNSGLGGGLVYSKTMGTTGEPLIFFRDRAGDAQHRATVHRGYRWYGIEPWMRSGLMWGIPSGRGRRVRMRIEDTLQNRFRQRRFDLTDNTLEAFCGLLEGARFVEGYSSMLFELARYINERRPGGHAIPLRLVKATSEKIYPHYHGEALKAFGRRMTSEYGSAEAGIIAFECPEGRMHVNTDHVIVEVEDGGIVVTNLLSYSFPFIRYRLGDQVRLQDRVTCACGRGGAVIEEVTGRIGRRIHGTDGRTFPSLSIYYVIKSVAARNDLLVRCRMVQREKGWLDVLVVLRPGATDRDRSAFEVIFEEVFRGYFDSSLAYRMEIVGDIPRLGGKHVDFISEIPDE